MIAKAPRRTSLADGTNTAGDGGDREDRGMHQQQLNASNDKFASALYKIDMLIQQRNKALDEADRRCHRAQTSDNEIRELRDRLSRRIKGFRDRKLTVVTFTSNRRTRNQIFGIHSMMSISSRMEHQLAVSLREQAAHFKSIIATRSHIEDQISDDTIQGDFDLLFHGIQGFAVQAFRGVNFGSTVLRLSAILMLILRHFRTRASFTGCDHDDITLHPEGNAKALLDRHRNQHYLSNHVAMACTDTLLRQE